MKVGDLVQPLGSCSGMLGAIRCKLALVVEKVNPHHDQVKIACLCGSKWAMKHNVRSIEKREDIWE